MDKESFFEKYSNTSIFKHACSRCNVKSYNNITFIKFDPVEYFFDDIKYSYIRNCNVCFLNRDSEEIHSLKNVVGYENRFFKRRCSICKTWNKEYLKIKKIINTIVCYDCIDEIFGIKYYIIALEDNQNTDDDKIDEILSKIYTFNFYGIKYKKGDFRSEINSLGMYVFFKTDDEDVIRECISLLENSNLKYKKITEEECCESMNNYIHKVENE